VSRVVFDHVVKRFGAVTAVDELTLEVADGELMVLVGPSGSGKTTALRLLAGLEALTAGRIAIGDRVVNHVSARDRDIAMVFQDYALYPQMTVYDNMAFGLRRRRIARAEIERRVRAACDALGLDELLGRRPRELSGGQQQRVALGRALVRRPQVLLMDEPLSSLDAQLRVQARGEIRRLQRRFGTTTVYVTHDQVEAMTLGDRIAVVSEGRLEQVGTPDEVYEDPANVFVGGFIGSPPMSFVAGDEGLLGVRPEHVRPWSEGDGLLGPYEGRVAYVEALGRETVVGVDTDGGGRLVALVGGRAGIAPGDRISLGLEPRGVRRFGGPGRPNGPSRPDAMPGQSEG
jgi:multiple sugar transport system ATP-binding protein